NIRSFRFGLNAWKWDQLLGHVDKRNERFTAAHAYCLEIFHLFSMAKCFLSLFERSPATGERLNGQCCERSLLTARDSQAQTDVKGQRQVHIGKLILGIQIRWIGDDPPSPTIRMDIPDVMQYRVHLLGVDLLSKLHDLLWRLIEHVPYDMLTLLLSGFQHLV